MKSETSAISSIAQVEPPNDISPISSIAGNVENARESQFESMYQTLEDKPGISEKIARAAFEEVVEENALTGQELTKEELALQVEHRIGFYQVKQLMNAMQVAEEQGVGDELAQEIHAVGGETIMRAMGGDELAKTDVARHFEDNPNLRFFSTQINDAENQYLSDYMIRMGAYQQAAEKEYFPAIIAQAQALLARLRKGIAQVPHQLRMDIESYISLLENAITQAKLLGVRALSSDLRSIISMAAI